MTPTIVYSTAPIRTTLPIGSMSRLGEERLVRTVADHRDVAPADDFLLGEDAAGKQLGEVDVHEALGRPDDRFGRVRSPR